MGLRDRIKGALHPEREPDYKDGHATQDDTTYRGRKPAAVEDTDYTAEPYRDIKHDSSRSSTGSAKAAHAHRKTDSGVDFGDKPYTKDEDEAKDVTRTSTSNTRGQYWGNMMSQGRNSPPRKADTLDSSSSEKSSRNRNRKDLPLRPDEQTSASAMYDDGDDDNDARYDNHGTYNTVVGAGSRDYDSSRFRDTDTSRGDKTTALGAAGQTRDRDTAYDSTERYQPGGGVPQSSMLDPYKSSPVNSRARPHDASFANRMDPYADSDRDSSYVPGAWPDRFGASSKVAATSNVASHGTPKMASNGASNSMDSHETSSKMASHGAPNVASSGSSSNGASNMAAMHGMGPGHFGPGHEGAKVVHRCVGCGLDNDISQYFRKDVTYRMG